MSAQVDLSIAIVNYKTRKLLRNCLHSIFDNKGGLSVEVFVSDNASNDGSLSMVRSEFPDVNIFENNNNIGFASATNQGLRASKGRYLMLLNPDTLILDNALERIVMFMDGNSGISVIAPRLMNADGTLQKSCRSFPNLLNIFCLYIMPFLKPTLHKPTRYLTDFWDHSFSAFVDYAIGAALVLRSGCFDEAGYLDENFFVYGEEKDLSYRLSLKGYRTYYMHNVCIMHYGGQSSIINPQSLIYLHQSYIYYVEKHFKYFSRQLSKMIYFIGALLRYLTETLSLKKKKSNSLLIGWYIKNFKLFFCKLR